MPPPDPQTREGSPLDRATPSENVELAGHDEAERTAVRQIIEDIRATLQTPTDAERAWNEQARNRAELAAWISGRRRLCDLAEVS